MVLRNENTMNTKNGKVHSNTIYDLHDKSPNYIRHLRKQSTFFHRQNLGVTFHSMLAKFKG